MTEPALLLAPLACAVVLLLSGVAKYGDQEATRAAFVALRVPKALSSTTVVRLLPVAEIDWIESYGNYLKVHAGRESHLIRGTMQSLEVKLDPETFVRVHRSAIVNIEKIKEIYPRSNGDQDLVLQNGQQLMLSRKYRDRFLAALGDL